MVHGAIKQFVEDVEWEGVDNLVIDLPPGTGDAQLTISQKANLTGTILVTTPQNISLIDVEKSLIAFRKLDIEVLGLIENMSYFTDDSGKDHYIFGKGNIDDFSEKHGIDLISNLPILPDLTKYSDNGTLFDEFENLSVLNKKYEEITDYLKNRISKIDKTDSLDTIPVVTE